MTFVGKLEKNKDKLEQNIHLNKLDQLLHEYNAASKFKKD